MNDNMHGIAHFILTHKGSKAEPAKSVRPGPAGGRNGSAQSGRGPDWFGLGPARSGLSIWSGL